MIARTHHLHDERLFDCYLAEQAGDVVDPPAAEHLFECAQCAARFDELAHFMDTVRADGEAQADEIFTPERLWNQHQAILHRLEQVGRPARVISFPDKISRRVAGATTRVTPRWLAAAAAAGLFVGVAVGGMFFDNGVQVNPDSTIMARSKPAPVSSATPPVLVTTPASMAVPADDERFLVELEEALQNPGTRELLPFDALTPHVRDISVRLQ
ncbi:MAG: hypothetical protein GEU82_00555 [Luteitalea sp.]|nr:hypothetical protein [Luteitalea sp.]